MRAQAADQGHRQAGHPADNGAQGQQAGRIGPLQIVHADHQRPGQGQCLRQVGERVDDPEQQARITGHRDRVPVPHGPGQQVRDRRPVRVS